MNIAFMVFASSSSKRARETTQIIEKYITKPKVKYHDQLKEGKPIFPEPNPLNWNATDNVSPKLRQEKG